MKKFLAAVSALLLTLCMFTGCAAEQSSQQQSTVTCADDLVGKKIGVQIGTTGMTYAAARADAAETLRPGMGTLLRTPNNILGIEYCKAILAQGAALTDNLMQGALSVVSHWFGPDTAIQMAASYAGTPVGVTDGSAAIAVIGGADGPTAIFVTSRYNAQALWGLAVKVFSNVLVIVLNYVFSKLIIFKKK